MRYLNKIISTLLIALLFISFSIPTYAQSTLDEAKKVVKENYFGTIDGNIDEATSIKELMNMLDRYSEYYTYEEYLQLTNTIEQKNIGIGVIIQKSDEGILLIQVIENGSAYEAGLEVGDLLLEVDGVSLKGLTEDEASSKILGKEGTELTLKIKKVDGSITTKTLMRKSFVVPVVTGSLLYGNIGYIYVSSFSSNAAYDVMNTAKKLEKDGASSFIVDLQYNSGGYVNAARQMISLFPNSKFAYIEKSNFGIYPIEPISIGYQLPGKSRLLINRYSASASEMVAASLLDQNGAILYGEPTYGKGVMQGFFTLSDGGILKLTEAEFTGPNETKINKTSVTPNVKTTEDAIYQAHLDALIEQYPTYRKMSEFKNVSPTKTFTIKFSKDVATAIPENAIELVQLGGSAVPIKVSINTNEVIVTPSKPLESGSHYTLFIHPDQFGTKRNILLRTGYYMPISVTN